MSALRALAPAKINLGLALGPLRPGDERHEIVTVMQSISLADELTLAPGPDADGADEVVCAGVPGPPAENLAAVALRGFRDATGWDERPVRLSIIKRIPVAAGLGGGSADAAATLRLLACASGRGDEALLRELARGLGADVPAQVAPGRWLATGAGERLERLPDPDPPLELVLLPLAHALATRDVYAEADRQRLARPPQALAERVQDMREAFAHGAPAPGRGGLLDNDLQAAANSLCPPIAAALELAGAHGARAAFVSGSGPTVVALFASSAAGERADRAAVALADRRPAPIRAHSVGEAFARPRAAGPA